MEYVAIAQGQGITPHSFKNGGVLTLLYMQLGTDKVSVDGTWQIECKVESSYGGLLLIYSKTASYTWTYCRPTYQSTWSAGCLWHVRLRFAAASCHHWSIEGQLSFKVTYWSWQFHRPTGLSSCCIVKNNKLWHCHPNCKPWKNPQGYSWNSVLIHFEWRPADRSQ